MARRVKGLLFLEFVRIIRSNKEVDWESVLQEDDQRWLTETVDPGGWYEMAAFERLGLAILDEIADGNLEQIRAWGRGTIDHLSEAEPYLVATNDPQETFMRFQTLRQALFDFPSVVVRTITTGRAVIEVDYGMSARAEEAAAYQTLGFMERLLGLSGARDVGLAIVKRGWESGEPTKISITWA